MNDFASEQPVTFTLGEAAKAADISKPTLSRAIKTGRLSAEKLPDGSYSIQAGELFRVYPPGVTTTHQVTPSFDDMTTVNADRLAQEQISRLREQLAVIEEERLRERAQLTDQVADLRRRLDQEGEERRKLTAILTAPAATSLEPAPSTEPASAVTTGTGREKLSLWERFTGRVQSR